MTNCVLSSPRSSVHFSKTRGREEKEMKWQLLQKALSVTEGFIDVKAFLLYQPTVNPVA